jgi:hypothetical protein
VTEVEGFEDGLREQLLDQAERRLIGEQDNLVFQAIQKSHSVLDTAADRRDYDIENVKASLSGPTVSRDRNSVTVVYGWDHVAAPYFEFGTSPHTIEGNPILSFVWEDAPEGIRERFSHTERVDGDPRVFLPEVEHPGTPALRFIRAGLQHVRSELDEL